MDTKASLLAALPWNELGMNYRYFLNRLFFYNSFSRNGLAVQFSPNQKRLKAKCSANLRKCQLFQSAGGKNLVWAREKRQRISEIPSQQR